MSKEEGKKKTFTPAVKNSKSTKQVSKEANTVIDSSMFKIVDGKLVARDK